ncbi:MAG TPA: hypothetical protein VH601_06785 [Bryobacteraceae bacterium]|jgi:hypothetical protein
MSSCGHLPFLFALILLSPLPWYSQTAESAHEKPAASHAQSQAPVPVAIGQSTAQTDRERRARAQEQLKQQERQRILGVIPNFNTSLIPNAEPLSPSQKFHLAFKNTLDPFQFVVSGIDAGLSQHSDDFAGYGQGAQGYAKRFAASYVDAFDATILGGAVFPVILRQDPRYFRLGTGDFKKRLFYAVLATVRAKGDNRQWQPNYSSLLGNLAAGGISNLYYPSDNRGVGLTFERAFIETAEGAFGNIFVEFWPDISHKLFHTPK